MTQIATYIGTKVINAIPMNRAAYNAYRNWQLPRDENGEDEGYLIEYVDGGARNDERHEGYISWSPKDVFDGHYQRVDTMGFGHALEFLKKGKAVARAGWNGKGMFLYLVPANAYLPTTEIGDRIAKDPEIANTYQGHVPYGAYIAMKTAQGNVVPWLCSQTDALAEDWMVL